MCLDERLRDRLRHFKRFLKTPLRFNWRQDMQTFATCRFDERMIAERLEMFLELQRELRDPWECVAFRWIEIVDDVIRCVEMRRARMHLVQFDARQIRQPDEGS